MAITSSCTEDLLENPTTAQGNEFTITAYLDPQTKTGLIDKGDNVKGVKWISGDQVSVFFGSGTGGGNIFTTESTGETATFTGTISSIIGDLSGTGGASYFWGLYPYSSTVSCDGTYLTTSLSSSQNAYAGQVANGLLVTAGRSLGPAIHFKNACAVVGFTLSQKNISKIVFRGNDDEDVAGEFKISFDANDNLLDTPTAGAVKEITVTPASGSVFQTGTTYYFALLPGTFSSGYSIEFTKSSGSTATYTRSTSFGFNAGTFYTMTNKDNGLTFMNPNALKPLTFTSTGSSTISLDKVGNPAEISLEYRINNGAWAAYDFSTLNLSTGEAAQFRAGNTGNAQFSLMENYYQFSGSGSLAVSGNIMSLVDKTLSTTTLPGEFCFLGLFSNLACLSSASCLVLPATTLTHYCYSEMFSRCTSLTAAPELPATSLAMSCYGWMFWDCTSLTTAPELPATKMESYCYEYMFRHCTSLTTAPELPATKMETSCYDGMFCECSSLTTAPELPATTLAPGCYESMFSESALTAAPELPATKLEEYCYYGMFSGCPITAAPELSATTLVEGCYGAMFVGCGYLAYVKMMATNASSDILMGWLDGGVPETGTFVKNRNATWDNTDIVPSGWTVLTE